MFGSPVGGLPGVVAHGDHLEPHAGAEDGEGSEESLLKPIARKRGIANGGVMDAPDPEKAGVERLVL